MFCLECDIHIVIYSKDLMCKRQQCYILLKKNTDFYILFFSVDKTDEGSRCVYSIYLSLFIVPWDNILLTRTVLNHIAIIVIYCV